ncbi:MAG: magnesium and cobalt transport protein CorA [Acidimicrobiales bacterium]
MIIDCAVYEKGVRRPGELALQDAFEAGRSSPEAFVWVGLYEPTEGEFTAVRQEFDLHSLAVEDAITAHQRPKIEVYDDSLFVVVKTARYDDPTETVEFGEIQIFVGDGFVVTVRHGQASALSKVRHRLEANPELLHCGPAAVLHAIADRVVDDYGPVLAGLDNDMSEIEAEVFNRQRGSGNLAERIYFLKHEVLDFHRNTKPFAEALDRFAIGALPYSHPELGKYFRDVHDHLLKAVAEIETMRDLLSDALDANLAAVTVRQNDGMRKISALVAVGAVPTVVGAIYGMNFEHMPELRQTWGYPLVLGVTLSTCFWLWRRFKRAGWL